jgi:TatD DNase family protein
VFLDAHCHLDQYPYPLEVLQEALAAGVFVVGVTNSPSAFEEAVIQFGRRENLRLALGFHPLAITEIEDEFSQFVAECSLTSFIGEVGLDASRVGKATLNWQEQRLKEILCTAGKAKIYSLHARGAEAKALQLVNEAGVRSVVFHWFCGGRRTLADIVAGGYYFSVNPSMCQSKSGRETIAAIPLDRLLTESDGPFLSVRGLNSHPRDIRRVVSSIAEIHGCGAERVKEQVWGNFLRLVGARS